MWISSSIKVTRSLMENPYLHATPRQHAQKYCTVDSFILGILRKPKNRILTQFSCKSKMCMNVSMNDMVWNRRIDLVYQQLTVGMESKSHEKIGVGNIPIFYGLQLPKICLFTRKLWKDFFFKSAGREFNLKWLHIPTPPLNFCVPKSHLNC